MAHPQPASDGKLAGRPAYSISTLPAHYLLSQVAANVKTYAPDASVTIPIRATWTAALMEASQAVESSSREMFIFPKRRPEMQEALRKQALSAANFEPLSSRQGLPIRSPFPKHKEPPRASAQQKENFRKIAKENSPLTEQKPYILTVRANLTERLLPTVSGTLRLQGLDAENISTECSIDSEDMLWDTGSHSCTITEDLLPPEFLKYLREPEHDPYRNTSGTKVHVDAYLGLSNTEFFFNLIFTVIPLSSAPNHRSGVILGQHGFLDAIVTSAVPRSILVHRGEEVEESIWGDISVHEYLDSVGDLAHFHSA